MSVTAAIYLLHEREGKQERYTVIPTLIPDGPGAARSFDPVVPFFSKDVSDMRREITEDVDRLWGSINRAGTTEDPSFLTEIRRIGRAIIRMLPRPFRFISGRDDISNVIFITNDAEIPWLWAGENNRCLGVDHSFGMIFCDRIDPLRQDFFSRPESRSPAKDLGARLQAVGEGNPYTMLILADAQSSRGNRRREDLDRLGRNPEGEEAEFEPLQSIDGELEELRKKLDGHADIIVIRSDEKASPIAAIADGISAQAPHVNILHYSGHIDRKGNLVVGPLGSRIRPQDIYDFNFTLAKKPIVFLNGCGSGRVGSSWRQTGSLATAFLDVGAQGCVVSLMPVTDRLAAEFAVRFYEDVLDAQTSVGHALRRTRRAILGDDENGNDASAYFFNFYGDPRATLAPRSNRRLDLDQLPPGMHDWDEELRRSRQRGSMM